MTSNGLGGGQFLRRLRLVGQPYWFGSMQWNWALCLIGLAVIVGTVLGLNMAVSAGKMLVLGWMGTIDAPTMLAAVNNIKHAEQARVLAKFDPALFYDEFVNELLTYCPPEERDLFLIKLGGVKELYRR